MSVYAQRQGERPNRRRTRRILCYRLHCSAKLLSEARRTRRPSCRSETDLRGDESGRSNSKFAPANQIDSFGKQVRTSESDRPVQTTSSHQRIRSTRSDNKFAPANQIDPFGQQVHTSQSYWAKQQDRSRSIGPLDCGYILRSSRRSDGYQTVRLRLHSSKFENIGRLSDCYIRLHYSKFEKIGRSSDRYNTVPFLKVL